MERRLSIRHPYQRESVCRNILGTSNIAYPVTIKNLSVRGIGMMACRAFAPGTLLSVQLHNPTGSHLCLRVVQVRRVEPQPGQRWLLGCSFAFRLADDELTSLL